MPTHLIRAARELGVAEIVSLTVFVAALAFGFAYFRRLRYRHRMAFIPLSLLPVVIGLFDASSEFLELVANTGKSGVFDQALVFFSVGEVVRFLPLACLETIVLLLFSVYLLLEKGGGRETSPANPEAP